MILLLIVTYYAPPGNTLQHVNTPKIERYTILLKIVIMEEYFLDKNFSSNYETFLAVVSKQVWLENLFNSSKYLYFKMTILVKTLL